MIGMDCARCTTAVSVRIRKVPGVSRVGINYFTEEATVEYDSYGTTPEEIMCAIRKAGYKSFETKGKMV